MEKVGFAELEHTADWALKVWSPNLETLLITAAEGMYKLSEVILARDENVDVQISLKADDDETLLVDFLSELVFYAEKDNLAFYEFNLAIRNSSLEAMLVGSPILSRKKEIKAVTYHNLEIIRNDDGLEVTIVFDV